MELFIKISVFTLVVIGLFSFSERVFASQDPISVSPTTEASGNEANFTFTITRSHAYAWAWLFDSNGNQAQVGMPTSCNSNTCTWTDFSLTTNLAAGTYAIVESYSNGATDYTSFCGGLTTYSACLANNTGQTDPSIIITGGGSTTTPTSTPPVNQGADLLTMYLGFFPAGLLAGTTIGLLSRALRGVI